MVFKWKKKWTIRFFLIYPVYAVPLDTDYVAKTYYLPVTI